MNCSQLYIGVEKRLNESRSEIFSVRLVPSASPEAKNVRSVIGSKYIYYLEPHTGCGCGWDFLDIGTSTDELNRQSCEALGHFLAYIEQSQSNAKLYSACIESLGTPSRQEKFTTAGEFMSGITQLRVQYGAQGAKVYVLAPNNSFKPTPLRGAA